MSLCQLYKDIECCKAMLLWHIHVTSKNKTHIGLAEQIVVTDKSLCNLSVFVSVARKHFGRLDRINQLCGSINYYECVCILAFIFQQANHIFSLPHYIVICDVSGCAIFFSIIS
jgi:hypothetical protein